MEFSRPWKFPGPGKFHGKLHVQPMEISRSWKFPWGRSWKFPWPQKLAFCTMVGFFVTIAKLSSRCVLGLTIPIFYNIIWAGLNRTLKADNRINLLKKSGVGHGNFHGPKRKRILLYERKIYFNPVHMISSGKLCPIIRNIFKKNIKIHLENPTA